MMSKFYEIAERVTEVNPGFAFFLILVIKADKIGIDIPMYVRIICAALGLLYVFIWLVAYIVKKSIERRLDE